MPGYVYRGTKTREQEEAEERAAQEAQPILPALPGPNGRTHWYPPGEGPRRRRGRRYPMVEGEVMPEPYRFALQRVAIEPHESYAHEHSKIAGDCKAGMMRLKARTRVQAVATLIRLGEIEVPAVLKWDGHPALEYAETPDILAMYAEGLEPHEMTQRLGKGKTWIGYRRRDAVQAFGVRESARLVAVALASVVID